MTDAIPHLTLNDGQHLPQIGFGTWPLDDAQAQTAVQAALACGYRLIDTAARYGNEAGVGRGIAASGVARSQVQLTSKLRGSEHGFDSTLRAFDATLAALGTDYLDLYLIHWPLPMRDLYVDTWRAFIRLREEGRIRSIGVSNFQPAHIDRLLSETGVLPAVNQIELHPDFTQAALRAWHARQGIVIECWSPLGRGEVLKDATVARIAQKHGRSAGANPAALACAARPGGDPEIAGPAAHAAEPGRIRFRARRGGSGGAGAAGRRSSAGRGSGYQRRAVGWRQQCCRITALRA